MCILQAIEVPSSGSVGASVSDASVSVDSASSMQESIHSRFDSMDGSEGEEYSSLNL